MRPLTFLTGGYNTADIVVTDRGDETGRDILYSISSHVCEKALYLPASVGSCARGQFQCQSSYRCVRHQQLCDGVSHCTDASDELLCCMRSHHPLSFIHSFIYNLGIKTHETAYTDKSNGIKT